MCKYKSNLDIFFSNIISDELFNGAICIRSGSHFYYNRFNGYSDFESKSMIDNNSNFEIASVTKQFTALGIMQLKEKGLVNYYDDIKKYIYEIPYENITVKNLLNHTAGIPDYTSLFHENWDKNNTATNKDVLEYLVFYKPKMLFQPGERWEYSNTGYVLLGTIIERVSGMSFQDYMKKYVFEAVGMHNTFVVSNHTVRKTNFSDAKGYAYDYLNDKLVQARELEEFKYSTYLGGIYGDGGIRTTLTDLSKWERSLDANVIIEKDTWIEATSQTVLNDGSIIDYGFGWQIVKDNQLGKVIYHGGSWPGYSASLIKYIDEDASIIYMSNYPQDVLVEQSIVLALENIIFGKPYEMPKKTKISKWIILSEEIIKSYLGTFWLNNGYRVFITAENSNLYMQVEGQNRFIMRAISQDEFIINEVGATILFKKNNLGHFEKMVINQANEQIIAYKDRRQAPKLSSYLYE